MIFKHRVFGYFADIFESYCWTENVYTEGENGKKTYHAWYKWVSLTLIGQALLFYLPHYIWKLAEGGRIGRMVKGRDDDDEPESKEDKRRAAVQYFIQRLGTHNSYIAKYVACEVLNFINVLFQIYFMNWFLNNQFKTFGFEVIQMLNLATLPSGDGNALTSTFPRYLKCTYTKSFGVTGSIDIKDGYCYASINR